MSNTESSGMPTTTPNFTTRNCQTALSPDGGAADTRTMSNNMSAKGLSYEEEGTKDPSSVFEGDTDGMVNDLTSRMTGLSSKPDSCKHLPTEGSSTTGLTQGDTQTRQKWTPRKGAFKVPRIDNEIEHRNRSYLPPYTPSDSPSTGVNRLSASPTKQARPANPSPISQVSCSSSTNAAGVVDDRKAVSSQPPRVFDGNAQVPLRSDVGEGAVPKMSNLRSFTFGAKRKDDGAPVENENPFMKFGGQGRNATPFTAAFEARPAQPKLPGSESTEQCGVTDQNKPFPPLTGKNLFALPQQTPVDSKPARSSTPPPPLGLPDFDEMMESTRLNPDKLPDTRPGTPAEEDTTSRRNSSDSCCSNNSGDTIEDDSLYSPSVIEHSMKVHAEGLREKDFAYSPPKTPRTEEEWESMQAAAAPYGNHEWYMAPTGVHAEKFNVDEDEAEERGNGKEAELLPATVYTPPKNEHKIVRSPIASITPPDSLSSPGTPSLAQAKSRTHNHPQSARSPLTQSQSPLRRLTARLAGLVCMRKTAAAPENTRTETPEHEVTKTRKRNLIGELLNKLKGTGRRS